MVGSAVFGLLKKNKNSHLLPLRQTPRFTTMSILSVKLNGLIKDMTCFVCRSQSKASYLSAYKREPREREKGLPNFEGSYKRTASPNSGRGDTATAVEPSQGKRLKPLLYSYNYNALITQV